VVAFQESDVYDIHRARCTGALHFRNQKSRNDWVWVQAGPEEMYRALRARLLAKLVALVKITDYTCENAVPRVAAVRMLSAVNSGFPWDIHGLVTVQMREDSREFRIVDVGTIHGLAHLIPEGERPWLVNSRIDLRTLNEVYQGIGIRGGRGGWLCVGLLVLGRLCHNKRRRLANCTSSSCICRIYRSNCLENNEYYLVDPIHVTFGTVAPADIRDSRRNTSGRAEQAM